MRVRSAVFALIVFTILGCHWKRTIATDVELSGEPLAFDRKTLWRFDASTLDLCIEPRPELRRDPFPGPGHFITPEGDVVEISLTLTSPNGHSLSMRPGKFYLNRNLACFNLDKQVDPSYTSLALKSAPPVQVDRVYWYWYFYH